MVTLPEEKQSFWARLFSSPRQSTREQKVLEYIIHRMDDGLSLQEAADEQYVRRNLSRTQIEDIKSDPRLVETARERMQEAFRSGELDPKRRSK
jgi:hypothetical protein